MESMWFRSYTEEYGESDLLLSVYYGVYVFEHDYILESLKDTEHWAMTIVDTLREGLPSSVITNKVNYETLLEEAKKYHTRLVDLIRYALDIGNIDEVVQYLIKKVMTHYKDSPGVELLILEKSILDIIALLDNIMFDIDRHSMAYEVFRKMLTSDKGKEFRSYIQKHEIRLIKESEYYVTYLKNTTLMDRGHKVTDFDFLLGMISSYTRRKYEDKLFPVFETGVLDVRKIYLKYLALTEPKTKSKEKLEAIGVLKQRFPDTFSGTDSIWAVDLGSTVFMWFDEVRVVSKDLTIMGSPKTDDTISSVSKETILDWVDYHIMNGSLNFR